MIASAPSDFTEMVNMGMRLEEGFREGRLSRDEDSSAKWYRGFANKKEGEAYAVSSHIKRRPSVKRKTVRPASNQHQAYQPRNNNNTSTSYDRKRVTFDPIPMTYAELYPSLIDRKLINPCDPPAVLTNPQWWYKPELHCVYHSGALGHDGENCYPLKTKVQDLVRSGILFFEDVGPNVNKNPFPEHGKSAVNMVQGCPSKYKVMYVSHIRQSLVEMHRLLCGYSHYEHDHDRFRVCTVNERGCRQVRKDIQEMLDQGVIEILQNRDEDEVNVISPIFRILEPIVVRYDGSKKKVSPSLIIKPAGPVPYSSDKVVPYRYNAAALEDGKEVSLPSTSVVSISDVSGVTRNGRVFSALPKPQDDMRKDDAVDNSASPVGTSSSSPNPALVVDKSTKAPVPVGQHGILKEDCDEMLRLIKRREYNVVDQLLETPSKISVLSLLMNSEPHREALQRVLDVEYVDHDVTIEQFDSIVANITAWASHETKWSGSQGF
ncbi:hypothetical protein KIW84_031323 [Lathyrus oleraceus]|uniref:Uncharacterized protein n=1 Tax=Pisum sativum TaxID=3888 RepID=A0A9D4XS01_PEA|nr:hypothetical protein KIW84_031323 [Pisum sativum]